MQVFSMLFPLRALTRARNRQGIERTQLSLIAKDQFVCQMSGLETATTRLPPRPDVVTKKAAGRSPDLRADKRSIQETIAFPCKMHSGQIDRFGTRSPLRGQ